jgi:hypothetical protein
MPQSIGTRGPLSSHPRHYLIRVEGHLGPGWSEWFAGMTLTHTDTGDTLLSGPVVDQAALHGLLAKIRDLNLTLVALEQLDPAQPIGTQV